MVRQAKEMISHARYRAVRLLLRQLTVWKPMTSVQTGYTVILGCLGSVPELLELQLAFFEKQRRRHLKRLVIVFDQPVNASLVALEERLQTQYAGLPLQFVHYSPQQAAMLKRIGWSKCYSWLSWALGVGAVKTRFALLHDLDAFFLDDQFLEKQYHQALAAGARFLGYQSRDYADQGVTSPRFAGTWEMLFDAAAVRECCQPIELFNRVRRIAGRSVVLDTFHDVQHRLGDVASTEGRGEDLVHITQLICQIKHLLLCRRDIFTAPANMNLLMLPYLQSLAGGEQAMDDVTVALCAGGHIVPILGRQMDIRRLRVQRVEGLRNMMRQLDCQIYGSLREATTAYGNALERSAGCGDVAAAAGQLA